MNPNDPLKPAIDHHRAGRLAEAETLYRQAVARNANDPRALHLLGAVLVQRRRPDLAVPLLRAAARVAPHVPDIHHALGEALRLTGAAADAEAAYQKAISLRPLFPQAHHALGLALVAQRKVEAALASWRRAIQIKPDFPDPYVNLGTLLAERKQFDEAAAALTQAITLNPNFAAAHNNLANVLDESGDPTGAIAHWQAALRIQPRYLDALVNLGRRLNLLGRHDESIDVLTRALAIQPEHASARFLRGIALLLRGDLATGFADYRYRTLAPELRLHNRTLTQPEWDGRSDLTGRHVLIHSEQGLGDAIQFVRYAPLLAERGARVSLECAAEIATLMTTVPGIGRIIPRGQPLPPVDVHAPVLDLPRLFGTTLETVPANVPYLAADPQRAARWGALLAGTSTRGSRVGLVWAGSPKHANDKNRSIPLKLFDPLADVPGRVFYSLQKGPHAAAQVRDDPAPRLRLIDHTADLHDFADTAALLAQLDLIITVDTSVAHLAGAMARPVWVLLPHHPDWRWMLGRSDSPWYPTMRLFRQPAAGDWRSVLTTVAAALSPAPG